MNSPGKLIRTSDTYDGDGSRLQLTRESPADVCLEAGRGAWGLTKVACKRPGRPSADWSVVTEIGFAGAGISSLSAVKAATESCTKAASHGRCVWLDCFTTLHHNTTSLSWDSLCGTCSPLWQLPSCVRGRGGSAFLNPILGAAWETSGPPTVVSCNPVCSFDAKDHLCADTQRNSI